MRQSVFYCVFIVATMLVLPGLAQKDKSKRPSPPAVAEGTIDGIHIRIDYSAPSARGRKMLGSNEPYGTVWRTGANETTSIEFSGPVKVEGKDLAKGKYALFTIPGETAWTIIINTGIHMGAFSYKESEDVLRVKVESSKTKRFVETFNISIVKKQVVLTWENTLVAFNVSK